MCSVRRFYQGEKTKSTDVNESDKDIGGAILRHHNVICYHVCDLPQ